MVNSIEQISCCVKNVLATFPTVEAALLMGSCSRGEETYFVNTNGETELLSDYEILIIVSDNSDLEKCDSKMQSLARELLKQSSSPCFSLDWSYKTKAELKRLDNRFIFFETKEAANVIYGNRNILQSFPEITGDNLNYSELNTIIIHRLYHVLRDFKLKDDKYRKYLIARNTLDIPSASLPLMGILVGSYTHRNKVFAQLAREDDFPSELKRRLSDYLEMKKDYNSILYDSYDLDIMIKNFIKDFKCLYSYQCRNQKGIAFTRSTRMLLSAIYRRSLSGYKTWKSWSVINERLYVKMMYLLTAEYEEYSREIINVKSLMKKLYGYQ